MAKKNGRKNGSGSDNKLSERAKRIIGSVVCVVIAFFLLLSWFHAGGVVGESTAAALTKGLGYAYVFVPLALLIAGAALMRSGEKAVRPLVLSAITLFFLAGIGLLGLLQNGGVIGGFIGRSGVRLFGAYATVALLLGLTLIAVIVALQDSLSEERLARFANGYAAAKNALARSLRKGGSPEEEPAFEDAGEAEEPGSIGIPEVQEETVQEDVPLLIPPPPVKAAVAPVRAHLGPYHVPPLSLLERDRGKPGVGDIKANANLIKRTLQNFGIVVELDEISIGPSVTRYAIKPAEGVRLQRIVSLQNNLELALAASPVRIEAPIPGKSLVGIEVPNSSKMTVGLGTMLGSADFASAGKPLLVALGRDIAGVSHFGNLAKMPHLLIAGATGSGKSVTIHTIITSLIYRNSPQALRFIMIDPKRVELTLYKPLPHLLSPVITDAKRAIMALRWAGKEMARRYDILEEHRVRDIESYHATVLEPAKKQGDTSLEDMPYIVIVIDELADIMQTFPRELEAAIVRLAQMSRAIGIHLMLSTQRPSVNVITGLIKANVPARIALQVASQIDSRTIIDQAGAEKLLGAGDMLWLSSDMGKPMRLQSAFISEQEVKRVADWVGKNNDAELPIDLNAGQSVGSVSEGGPAFATGGGFGDEEEVDDDMYEAAKQAVIEAGKASTSYIQRKLRVGYARAARLMDVLEERGVIGPQDGAKPREVLTGANPGGANDETA
ncbi:MAG: DNA translocase FtsK [Minisyncoccia bacterium]